MIKIRIKKHYSHLYTLAAAAWLALARLHTQFGWPEHKFSRKQALVSCLAVFIIAYLAYRLAKIIYHWLIRRWRLSDFWRQEFSPGLDRLFVIAASASLVVFIENEIVKLVALSVIFIFIYWQIDRLFRRHQYGHKWQVVNRSLFLLGYFIFLLNAIFQSLCFEYYLMNVQFKLANTAFFRAWIVTMFWLAGFAIGGYLYSRLKGKKRYLAISVWIILLCLATIVEVINAGIVYFSGLYINPVALFHAEGAGAVIFGIMPLYLIVLLLAAPLVIFAIIIYRISRSYPEAPAKYWRAYLLVIIGLALMSFFAKAAIIRHTPEYTIVKSFYDYWVGSTKPVELDPIVRQKLERFGLFYNLNNFYVANHPQAYSALDTKRWLSDTFNKHHPNIIYIALESFSSRLSDVYDSRLPGITPGLKRMSEDPGTTIFYNYYNASTPTITGLLAQLCSFLPPTGHQEISDTNLRADYLLCLPRILKNSGYQYLAYITAVEKEYTGKNTLFASMGMDDVFGTAEIGQVIKEPARSTWGYSDHQIFSFMDWLIKNKAREPFFLLLSTVDSHQPFNLAKDIIPYGSGTSPLLNSIHTTDNAWGIFWDQFKTSDLYDNTIVVAVADHAVFPRSYDAAKDFLPQEASDQNLNFYDENLLLVYVPQSLLPKKISAYSSSIDLAPTLLELLGINTPNAFDGQSLLSARQKYPNILGMHEFGLYINQLDAAGRRLTSYEMPQDLDCPALSPDRPTSSPLTLCEYLNYYQWKRQMMDEGRLWYNRGSLNVQ